MGGNSVRTVRIRNGRGVGVCRGVSATLLALLFGLALFLTAPDAARAEQPIWATGKVLDAQGQPIIGAIVAVYNDSNKVVDYARTDRNGEYALAVPRNTLHLEKHGPGFVATVVGTAVRFGGDIAGFVTNPVRQGVQAITSAQADTISDPLTRGEFVAGGAVAVGVLGMLTPPHHHAPPPAAERQLPGCLVMKVIAPHSNDLVAIGRVYWMQEEDLKVGGRSKKTLAAWLDPVKMSTTDTETPSKFDSQYLRFTSVHMEPSLAEHGQTVHLSAKLVSPPDPHIELVVVARHAKTGEIWELHPTQNDLYETDIVVDKHFPLNDQSISILAYGAVSDRPGRRKEVEHALEKSGVWDPTRPFVYNPMMLVSRNRADVTLTVLKPTKHKR